MFERYTEPARRALFFGREEVTIQAASSIEPAHLFLGLLREPGYVAAGVLSAAHLESDLLRKEFERQPASRASVPLATEIPFSASTKMALQFAAGEADRLGHPDIGPEHLLLGLLREGTSMVASVLVGHGLDLSTARGEVVRLRAAGRAPAQGSAPAFATGFGVEPADVPMLHGTREQLQAAENAFDPEPVIAMMADDIVLMVPNEPVQEGKAACAEFVRRTLADQQAWCDRVISYVSDEVSIRGEVAFDRGGFSFTVVGKEDGRKTEATGKYLWLYTKARDGTWKLARVILGLDDPPEGS